MSYQFSYELRPDTIYATIYGEKQAGELMGPYIYKILQHCFRLGRQRVAIERHVSCQITDSDLVELVRELARPDYASLQIAYVDDRFHTTRPSSIGIDIRDSAFVSPRIFASRTEAQNWLELSSSTILSSSWPAISQDPGRTFPAAVLDYSANNMTS
jgi:hypothetical protein